jgi:hypothetical protein
VHFKSVIRQATMKKTLITAIFFISFVATLLAQQAKTLQFREESFDFGTVSENKGPVTHEFLFTNNSSRPVKIINVQASCGCTTPGWSKDPVAPGKTGYIQASFEPKGRPGFFTKSLTVNTDLEANPIILQIKGQVADDQGPVDDTGFAVENGSLKFKVSALNVGKVLLKDEFATREFPVINAGKNPVKFTGQNVTPQHIKVEFHPAVLAAGAQGTIKVSYNGKMKNQYGFQSDNIEIGTDDVVNPVKSFSVFATLEDYFPQLSAAELEKAPQLVIGESNIDMGRIGASAQVIREVSFSNTGKKDLVIKAVQGNCACVKASAAKSSIKPGETSNFKVAFDPQGRSGTQTKAVTVYTNDPKNPVQRFTLTAYVD